MQIGERGLKCSGKYFSPLTGSAKSGFHGDDDTELGTHVVWCRRVFAYTDVMGFGVRSVVLHFIACEG